tara:strand:- start:310 stop:525 length:216 start_codon:yes stop_codon:yes gene_type:complete
MATTASLSSTLFRPDISVTTNLIWTSKFECDLVREAHLSVHAAPDNAALVCLRVPDGIAKQFMPSIPELKI